MPFERNVRCPNCSHEVPTTRLPLMPGLYIEEPDKCPGCGHSLRATSDDFWERRMQELEETCGAIARKIGEEIELHSGRKPLLCVVLLADTINAALQPLRSYAEHCKHRVCVVRSANEIAGAMAECTHVVVDITSGERWLPSKVLLDAKWGDRLFVDDLGAVIGGGSSLGSEPKRDDDKETTYRELVVPRECYLHFFCDRPFNPPGHFLERIGGRLLDLRSRRTG